ncbi:acyl-CoA thioesterase [Romeria aff. gracilis LEGE 07310]|uniref:Acyl-CoA thioesterase n=1 Tax=Vasconcelosia minhoensis LEGE 07310 TaxID=915328 RepID=A0A8J7AH80_9CYAN|nr:thioesterase family protein [Romeria gracilis]MBE9078899.1 acyl-CoA thioesterase [Romeria aff. gracilis LEGE 07310]
MPPRWFEYPFRVQPHHTDYSGVVWHGTYITWLEAARVDCLSQMEMPFDQIFAAGFDLPVIDLSLRYHQPLRLGMAAVVKARLAPQQKVRIQWLYEIETVGPRPQTCLTGQVTLVVIDRQSGKIVRRLPAEIQQVIDRLLAYLAEADRVGDSLG